MASGDRQEAASLIVVGASLAGMVAAVTAADHGHRVVLLERGKDLGGAAATESEAIAAAGTRFQRVADVDDAPERLLAEIGAGGEVDGDVARAVVEHSPVLVEWLADRCGAQVSLQSKTASGGHRIPRLHAVGEQGGASLAGALVRAASHHTHVRVRAGTEVERLLIDQSGGVVGVAVRPDRRGPTTIAGPVVLACGGFVASDELVGQHCAGVKDLPFLGTAGGKGDALRLALACGAGTRHVSACAVSPFVAQPSHFALPRAVVDGGGILVNQLGARFTEETADALPLALAVRGQPGRLAYLVFDERIAGAVAEADPFFARVVLPRTSRRAGSVGMLAKQLELPAGALDATLAAYGDGAADPHGRTRGRARIEPPLYGVRVTGARRATLGGLAVDASARVLDAASQPVAGLFAVGGAADGVAGGSATLPGVDALVALGLARLAALSLGTVEES
jgi:succinate dehydrogenase/fumarate reductase flavoprotein subunit